LSLAAGAWTYFMFTRAPGEGLLRSWRNRLHYGGFLVLTSLLLATDMVFFVYAIAGFFLAYVLRPWPLGVLAVFATSLLLNLGTQGVPRDGGGLILFAVVVGIQTITIGVGVPFGEKVEEQQEKRRQTMRKLEEALTENAELHAQLLVQAREAGIVDERQRMAREIHDTLAQGLAGIVTQLEATRHAGDPEVRDRHLAKATRLARDSLAEARRTVHAVRPQTLDAAQLPDAIADVAARWSDLYDTPAEVRTTGSVRPLHPEVEVTLLRTAQEALANVGKHAKARRVGLTLSYMEDVVTLDVRDDGVGFRPEAVDGEDTFGLTGMRQRVRRLAGQLEIESEPGGGTAISATVPAIPQVSA
jgi:signal transduction histidine kinase